MNFFQPNVGDFEVETVAQAMRQGHLATGKMVEQFEAAFKKKFGYKNAVAVNSGTTALCLSLHAMGVGPGDEVIVTAYSIAATVNCVLAMGATPVFCDVERDTYNMDPVKVQELVTSRTKAIIPASIFGMPCDAAAISNASSFVPIVEDSIEALGSTRNGKFIGAEEVLAATFGFYPNKQITTCQGGMIVTNDQQMADKLSRLRQHGYGKFGDLWNQGYGWNVRLPDPLAAMGVAQLARLDWMQEEMNAKAAMLDTYFKPFRKQRVPAGYTATHFVYVIELPPGNDKGQVSAGMQHLGVPTRPYFNALHRSPHVAQWYQECPVADEIGSRTLALPFHHGLTQQDVERIYAAFVECVRC